MGYTDDLLAGLAQRLDAQGIATWRPDSPYATGEIGIGIGDLPTDCDLALGITDYLTANDSPDQTIGTIGVQISFRSHPNDRKSMTDLRDAVFLDMQGLTGTQFGACTVNQVLRVSSVPLGVDDRDRHELADNYYIDIETPPTPGRT